MKKRLSARATGLSAVCLSLALPMALHAQEPWQDVSVVQEGNEPARATFTPQDLTSGTSRTLSQSLNGEWQFRLLPNVGARGEPFEQPDYDASKWGDIPVPANWELEGHSYPIYSNIPYPFVAPDYVVPTDDQNPVGQYRRTFSIPTDWDGKRVYVRFGGVGSAYTLWVNGKRVGYTEGKRTPVTFDITDELTTGANLMAVEVYRFSDGSYIENQDGWHLSGIYRNVDLFARNPLHVEDFDALTTLRDNYTTGVLDLAVTLKGLGVGTAATVDFAISRNGETEVTGSLPIKGSKEGATARQEVTLPNVAPWSAEAPNLYDLSLTLRDAKGGAVEKIERRIGFRSVELGHGQVLINGQPVVFRGVNIHEVHPDTGYVVDEATVRKDFQLLAEGNFNAIRTSHYPQAELFYDLADEFGFYVIGEANMEAHDLRNIEGRTPARKPEWAAPMLNRSQRMVERDKNHPSIVIWSPGNETGTGENVTAIYNWFKQRDPSRLVQYADDTTVEGDAVAGYAKDRPYGKASDYLSAFYPSYWDLDQYGQLYDKEPWIIAEYWHSMGNSLGNGKEYWNTIYRHPVLQGGFIWDWVDQGLSEHDKDGRLWYSQGGDYGPDDVPSSSNFLHNGVIFPDRTPKPTYWNVKRAYQPVNVTAQAANAGLFTLENRNAFTSLNSYDLAWDLLEDGTSIASGTMQAPDIAPGKTGTIAIRELAGKSLNAGREYHVNLALKLRQPTALLKAGHVVATEQFALPQASAGSTAASAKGQSQLRESKTAIEITSGNTVASIDRSTGLLSSVKANGRELLQSPLAPNTWRALTDNDYSFAPESWDFGWYGAGKTAKLELIKTTREAGDTVVSTRHLLSDEDGKPMADWFATYRIGGDGAVAVSARFDRRDGVRMPPRVGMRVKLPETLDQVEYFGRGPHENYIDRNWSENVGRYSSSVADMYTPYLRPQENGYRTDTRWFAVRDNTGEGVLFVGMDPVGFAALPFAQEDLEVDPAAIKSAIETDRDSARDVTTAHLNDVPATSDGTYISVDAIQAGVGGDNTWGKRTLNEYTPRDPSYEYGFVIVPLDATDTDLATAANAARTNSSR